MARGWTLVTSVPALYGIPISVPVPDIPLGICDGQSDEQDNQNGRLIQK